MKAVPFLLVLITEVEEAWSVEQELHQVVRDQQHQAQSVEAKHKEDDNTDLTEDDLGHYQRHDCSMVSIPHL